MPPLLGRRDRPTRGIVSHPAPSTRRPVPPIDDRIPTRLRHRPNDPRVAPRGVIYQIYPRSFQDSNGDGVGDLPGITARLDYLQRLGVDAIWISPIYPSPMADFGYDVADYTRHRSAVRHAGRLRRAADAAHARGLKVILDFVPNHTSDQHPWFLESRASRDNPKRDWYLWRDPAPDGGPPNNWLQRLRRRGLGAGTRPPASITATRS